MQSVGAVVSLLSRLTHHQDSQLFSLLGHPTCLQINELGDILYQYDWHCIDCKFCEVCREKGNEVRREHGLHQNSS